MPLEKRKKKKILSWAGGKGYAIRKQEKVSWLACSWAQNSASNAPHASWLWYSRNVKESTIKKKKRTHVSFRHDILSIRGIFSYKVKTNYLGNHSLEQLTFLSLNISQKTRGSHWMHKSSTKTKQPLSFYWWKSRLKNRNRIQTSRKWFH